MRWIVNALGEDRPGIVAGVTKVLFDLGCNLEDSAMSRLEGEFAIMLIFSTPKGVKDTHLEEAFEPVAHKLELSIFLKQLNARESRSPKTKPQYAISVYGADHPGIVYELTKSLAAAKVNVTDLSTHRTQASGRKKALYMLLVSVELPRGLKEAALNQRLKRLAKKLGVEVTLRAEDADLL